MCLRTITHPANPAEEGVGYKLFAIEEEEGKLFGNFALRHPDSQDRFVPCFERGKWLTDPNRYEIEMTYGQFYPTGYHFFEKKEDAELVAQAIACIALKIRYKHTTAKGTQEYYVRVNNGLAWREYPVIVAREIFIEDDPSPEVQEEIKQVAQDAWNRVNTNQALLPKKN
jgi:hypothetical protein